MNRRQLSQRCRIEAVAALDNLFLAADKARRGKARRPDVEAWWLNREIELVTLREELLSGSYEPGAYRFYELFRPKRRVIAAAPFRFLPGLRPRVLGETKRRFETRRAHFAKVRAPLARLSAAVFAWYQFSREGNTEGLRRAYAHWPFDPRLKRRRRRTHRVLRGASWNNNDRGNLLSSNRNNNGFRCVVGESARKTAKADDSARCGAGTHAFSARAKRPD